MVGHVRISEYQRDVDAVLDFADARNFPKPVYLVYSMGGAIGYAHSSVI